MAKINIRFTFLCLFMSVFLALVASEFEVHNRQRPSKYAGVKYLDSTDVRKVDIDFLRTNKCKFYVVERTIFYACPKRPTRYPSYVNYKYKVIDDDDDKDDVYYNEKFECPFPFGTYPHPIECSKFYLCIFNKPRTMTCDSKKLYDEYEEECAEKSTVDCGDRTGGEGKGTTQNIRYTTAVVKTTTKKENKKFKCPYTWGTFPNPDDCSQYYLCLNKKPSLKKCKPSELYDTGKRECRDKDKVDCNSRFNPREKTTPPPKTTVASTVCPTRRVTTEKEVITSRTQESLSPSEGTLDNGATDFSTVVDVSPSTESRTMGSTAGELTTPEQTIQSSEEPRITDDDTSDTGEPDSTSENTKITGDETGTGEPQSTSEKPRVTDNDTSDADETEVTSEESRITDEDSLHTEESKATSEKSGITDDDTFSSSEPKVTTEGGSEETEVNDSSVSEEPDSTGEDISTSRKMETTSGNLDEVPSKEPQFTPDSSEDDRITVSTESRTTEEIETFSDKSAMPVEETSSERSSDEITNADQEKSTDGEGKGTQSVLFKSTAETESEEISSTPGISVNTFEDVTSSEELDLTSPSATTKDGTAIEDGASSLPGSTADNGASSASSEEPNSTSGNEEPSGKQQTIPDYSTPSAESENTYEGRETSFQLTTTAEDRTSSQKSLSTFEDSSFSEKTGDADDQSSISPESDTSDEFHSTPKKYPETTSESQISSEVFKTSADQVTISDELITDKDEQKFTTADYNTETSNIATETTQTDSSNSPESFVCPRKNGNFPHEDCSSYYECREGDFTIESCSEGTLFHSTYTVCYNQDDVDCGDRKRLNKDERSTEYPISSLSPRDRRTTEVNDIADISTGYSSSLGNTRKTVDYTSVAISETSSSHYNTEKNNITSDVSAMASTASSAEFEISNDPEIDSTVGVTDYEITQVSTHGKTTERSEADSSFSVSSKETNDFTDATTDSTSRDISTNSRPGGESESVSTVDYASRETNPDEKTIETVSDLKTDSSIADLGTEETTINPIDPYTDDKTRTRSTHNKDASTESTTNHITDELSTQSIDSDGNTADHRGTSGATEEETDDTFSSSQWRTSTKGESTFHISQTTENDSQKETTIDHTTDSNLERNTTNYNTEDDTEAHSTAEIEETSSVVTNAKDTNEPSTQNIVEGNDDNASQHTSTGETTTEASSTEESTSHTSETKHSSPDEPDTSESTQTNSEAVTPNEKVIDTTSPKETAAPSAKPIDICPAGDNTCIVDDNGNVFRCPKSHGHFGHPTDSSRFIHCDNNRIHVLDCPKGLRFDPIHNVCTWATTQKRGS